MYKPTHVAAAQLQSSMRRLASWLHHQVALLRVHLLWCPLHVHFANMVHARRMDSMYGMDRVRRRRALSCQLCSRPTMRPPIKAPLHASCSRVAFLTSSCCCVSTSNTNTTSLHPSFLRPSPNETNHASRHRPAGLHYMYLPEPVCGRGTEGPMACM